MANINDILEQSLTADQAIASLKEKSIIVPAWRGTKGLLREYDTDFHPVMNHNIYPDVVGENGNLVKVTRVPLDYQRLAVERMTALVNGIPVKRVYSPEGDKQKEVAQYLEKIFLKNRINSVNNERLDYLFAACETMTLWYAVEQRNHLYGFDSNLKFRCRNFSPMNGDEIFPYFDEYGDLIALSVGYTRRVGRKNVQYFDTYTAEKHIKWSTESGTWTEVENDDITLGKIPAIYMYRPSPIWEKTSNLVYEIEWSLSRNGNYLRDNSKPLFVVYADEMISYGKEKSPNEEFKAVAQFPKGSTAEYVTWQQAKESLEFHVNTLRNQYFTLLQLPDWSYEKMSQLALSGESRKQLFVDAQMKVEKESGRLLEFFDREVSVVKAFLKVALGESYSNDIDALQVETQITPFTITDEKDTIDNLMNANGGAPIISQREAIEQLGWSDDVDKTMEEIAKQQMNDAFDLTA